MSNWINDEAEKFRLIQDKTRQTEYLIAFANYWADLTEQIRNDVDAINAHPVWKEVLQDKPIRIVKAPEGFKIEKLSFPAVYITLDNEGWKIKTKIEVVKNPHNSTDYNEVLEVQSNGKRIYLVNLSDAFLIPEQASKHILSPILKALKGDV